MSESQTHELDDRLTFYGIDPTAEEFAVISQAIEKFGANALDAFYKKVAGTPQTARQFSGPESMARAQAAQVRHWKRMFSGGLNHDYHAASKAIGDVHARIGLEPKWYIGGYANILAHVIESTLIEGLGKYSRRRRTEARMLATFVKVALLDMDLAITRYFEVEERERNNVIDNLGHVLALMAEGDLTAPLFPMPPAYQQIETDFRTTLSKLSDALRSILDGSAQITSTSAEIRSASDDLARRSEQQAATIEESAAAMDELTQVITETGHAMRDLNARVGRTREAAEGGGKVVNEAIEAMAEIEKGSAEIATIISIIDDIAFQTNLLALNAGVEAARVGEHGRGFAVVANEVRSLAQSSARAAEQIKDLIRTSGDQVSAGVKLVNNLGHALHDIVEQVTASSTVAAKIADASAAQEANLGQINAAISEMSEGVQRNAAMVEENNAAAHNMASEASEVSKRARQFKIREKRQAMARAAAA